MDTDQSANLLSSIQSEIAKYQLLIEEENQKLKKYKVGSYFLTCISPSCLGFEYHSILVCACSHCE